MSVSIVALGSAAKQDKIAAGIAKVKEVKGIELELKGYATSVEQLQGLLVENKPEAVLITGDFADTAEAIKEGIHSVNKEVKVVCIPAGIEGPEVMEYLKSLAGSQ